MTISRAMIGVALAAVCGASTARAKVVVYNLLVPIDTIRPDQTFKIGDVHGGRVVFDDSEVDPVSGRVHPIGFLHRLGGNYVPDHLDPTKRDTSIWLDVKSNPWRYSMNTDTDPTQKPSGSGFFMDSRRMVIRDPKDGSTVVAGPYHFEPAYLSDSEIRAILAPAPLR